MEENAAALKKLILELYPSLANFAREFYENQPGENLLTEQDPETVANTFRTRLQRDRSVESLAQYFTYIKSTDKFRKSNRVLLDPRYGESQLDSSDKEALTEYSKELDDLL